MYPLFEQTKIRLNENLRNQNWVLIERLYKLRKQARCCWKQARPHQMPDYEKWEMVNQLLFFKQLRKKQQWSIALSLKLERIFVTNNPAAEKALSASTEVGGRVLRARKIAFVQKSANLAIFHPNKFKLGTEVIHNLPGSN